MSKVALKVSGLFLLVSAAYLAWVWPQEARASLGSAGTAISADGSGVTYYDRGPRQGQVVVLLASLGRSVSDFNELVSGLNRAGYRTIAVQSRGVGPGTQSTQKEYTLYSLGEDVDAALEAAGVPETRPVTVIGHAFGNRVARAYSSRTHRPISHIVLLAAGGAQHIEQDFKARDALLGSFKWWLPPWVRRAAVRYAFFAAGSDTPDYWMGGWYLNAARMQIVAVKATNERDWRAGDGKSPILILQALNDKIAPPGKTSRLLKAQMPSRVVVVNLEHAGHALLPEQPKAILAAILAFLSR